MPVNLMAMINTGILVIGVIAVVMLAVLVITAVRSDKTGRMH
jgi:hypothetical protein